MRTGRVVVAIALTAAAAAILVLPSSRDEPTWPEDPQRRAENIAYWQFSRRASTLRLLHGMATAESAAARVDRGAGYALWSARDVPATTVERIRGGIARQLAALPARDTGMRLAVAVVVDTGQTLAGVPVPRTGGAWRTEVAVPGTVAPDVCGLVIRVSSEYQVTGRMRQQLNRSMLLESSPALLAACGWYLAYGAPGGGIARWLDSVRYAPISSRGEASLVGGRRRGAAPTGRAPGTRALFDDDLRALSPVLACAAGRTEWCATLLQNGPDAQYFPPTPSVAGIALEPVRAFTGYPHAARGVPRALLTQLEREIGPDAFRQLWRSPRPLDETFHDVRGMPLGDWIHGQIVAETGAVPAGPLPSRSTTLSVLIGTAAFLGLGLAGVTRRSGIP